MLRKPTSQPERKKVSWATILAGVGYIRRHEILRAAVEQVPDDLPVTSVHASGPPANAILSEVKRGNHDLIVMGSRGLGLARALMGSVSHRVLRHAPAAVLIVHAEPGTDAPEPEAPDQAARGANVSR